MPPPDDTAGYGRTGSFYAVLTEAVTDMVDHGYDGEQRVEYWIGRIREAAIRTMTAPHVLQQALGDAMRAVYRAQVERGGLLRRHSGASRFTLERVAPRLRAELDRRIAASAGLIKLNRDAAVRDTEQRFAGWATSIPAGGTDVPMKAQAKAEIRKSLAQLPFRERRVAIDQAHKFSSNLSDILAVDGGAIAAMWRSHWRRAGYNYREDHKERDGRFYLVRGNWALERGLIRADGRRYTDDVTRPGEEVFCGCYYQYVHSLRALPSDMLTEKGRAELDRVRLAA